MAIADSEGLRSFVPERDVPDEFMILEARAVRDRGWACFWTALNEDAATKVGDELASGRRRDAMNLLWVLAREIVRYPTGVDLQEADSCSVSSPAFDGRGSQLKDSALGTDA